MAILLEQQESTSVINFPPGATIALLQCCSRLSCNCYLQQVCSASLKKLGDWTLPSTSRLLEEPACISGRVGDQRVQSRGKQAMQAKTTSKLKVIIDWKLWCDAAFDFGQMGYCWASLEGSIIQFVLSASSCEVKHASCYYLHHWRSIVTIFSKVWGFHMCCKHIHTKYVSLKFNLFDRCHLWYFRALVILMITSVQFKHMLIIGLFIS